MRFKILNKYKEEVTYKNTKSMAEKAARRCGRENPEDGPYMIYDEWADGTSAPCYFHGHNGHRAESVTFLVRTERVEPVVVEEDVVEKSTEKHTGTDIQIIPRVFESNQITQIIFKGQPVLITKEVGKVLGYSDNGRSLVVRISTEWSDEFEEGIETIKLEGSQLSELKSLFVDNTNYVTSNKTQRLLLLTESGVNKVLMKTNKPVGKRLRKWLAREVLPSLRKKGFYELDKGKRNEEKHLLAKQRIAIHKSAERRKAIKEARIGTNQLLKHYTYMWKHSPTQDKEYWRNEIKELMENAKKLVSLETIEKDFQDFNTTPTNKAQLTEGKAGLDIETQGLKTVSDIPEGYFDLYFLANEVYGSTSPNSIRNALSSLNYHNFTAHVDHCLHVLQYDRNGKMDSFLGYDRHVVNELKRNSGKRLL